MQQGRRFAQARRVVKGFMSEGCGFYLNQSFVPPLVILLWQFRETASEGFYNKSIMQERCGDSESPLQ